MRTFQSIRAYCSCAILFATALPLAVLGQNPSPHESVAGSHVPDDVNLSTGKLSRLLALATLPGMEGLEFDLTAIYSSNISSVVSAWNLEASTGVMGLGWTLPRNVIVRDSARTGTSADDTYFLVSSDGMRPLRQISNNNGRRKYVLKDSSTNLQISYDEPTEEWIVVGEDGFKSHYGGGVTKTSGSPNLDSKTQYPLSSGNSVEWGVRWGNWVGPSLQATGQDNFAVAWNLSKLENTWGAETQFSYQATTAFVGTVGSARRQYTQAIYLKQIQNAAGEKLVLSYLPKESFEYQDPHARTAGSTKSTQLTGLFSFNGQWDPAGDPDPKIDVTISGDNNYSQKYSIPEQSTRQPIPLSYTLPEPVPNKVNIHFKAIDVDPILDDDMMDKTFTGVSCNGSELSNSEAVKEGTSWLTLQLSCVPGTSDPDAYQDRYETLFLRSVVLQDASGTILSTTQLNYNENGFLGEGLTDGSDSLKKRLLSSVERKVGSKETLAAPAERFTYYAAGQGGTTPDANGVYAKLGSANLFQGGALYGALASVQSPSGGITSYTYNRLSIQNSMRELSIASGENWSNPSVHFGPDYAVIFWQGSGTNANKIKLSAYHWFGRWIQTQLGTFSIGNFSDTQIRLESNFFALLTPGQTNNLYLFRLDPLEAGKWITAPQAVTLTAGSSLLFGSGDRFAAVIDSAAHALYRFTWNGGNWKVEAKENLLHASGSTASTLYALAAKQNFLFVVTAANDNNLVSSSSPGGTTGISAGAEQRLYRLDQDNTWSTPAISTIPEYFPKNGSDSGSIANKQTVLNKGVESLNLQASPSFAALQVSASRTVTNQGITITEKVFATYVYSWPADYSAINSTALVNSVHLPQIGPEKKYRTTLADNLLSVDFDRDNVSDSFAQLKGRYAYVFNGVQWFQQYFTNDSLDQNFTGINGISNTSDGTAQFNQFNPNKEAWDLGVFSYKDGNLTYFQKLWPEISLIGGLLLFPFDGEFVMVVDLLMLMTDLSTMVVINDGGSGVQGGRFFTGAKSVFFRESNGTWKKIGDLAPEDVVTANGTNITYTIDAQSTQNAKDFIAFVSTERQCNKSPRSIICADLPGYPITSSKIQHLKNGVLSNLEILPSAQSVKRDASDGSNIIGGNAYVSYANAEKLSNAKTLVLHKVIQGESSGALDDFVVSKVSLTDAYTKLNTDLVYTTETASADLSGRSANYNKVSTVLSGISTTLSYTNGSIDYYFLNGTTSSNVPANTLLRCDVTPCVDVSNNPMISVIGLGYQQDTCASSNDGKYCLRKAGESSQYQIAAIAPASGASYQGTGYAVQETQTTNHLDKVSTSTSSDYDAIGRLRSRTSTELNSSGDKDTIKQTFTYASEKYSAMQAANILSPLAETLEERNPPATRHFSTGDSYERQHLVTIWKNWGTDSLPRWLPAATYSARNNAAGIFDFGDLSKNSPSNWLKTNLTLARSALYGTPLEEQDASGLVKAVEHDSSDRLPVFEVLGASIQNNQAGYFGFETYEPGSAWTLVPAANRPACASAFTGVSCLSSSGSASTSISPAAFSAVPGSKYVVSAWFYPASGKSCTVGFKTQTSTIQAGASWQYLEWSGDPVSGELPAAVCKDGGSIDDFRFAPVDAEIEVSVFDNATKLLTASIGENAAVEKRTYDALFRPLTEQFFNGTEDVLRKVSHSYFLSRWQGGQFSTTDLAFDPKKPNSEQLTSEADDKTRTVTTYSDGLGRPIQEQEMMSNSNAIVKGIIYDGWGNPAVETLPIELSLASGYSSNFAPFDWSTGEMGGEVKDYFTKRQFNLPDSSPGISSNDVKYAYSRVVYENSPLARPIHAAKPGEKFRFGGTGNDTTDYFYGSASDYLLKDTTGISGDLSSNYRETQTTVPGSNQPSVGANWRTTQELIGQSGSNIARLEIGVGFDHDKSIKNYFQYRYSYTVGDSYSGGGRLRHYMPNSYDSTGKRSDDYSSSADFDYRGKLVRESDPDRGESNHLYDSLGRLRFSADAEDASAKRVRYILYDRRSRVLEKGYLANTSLSDISQEKLDNSGGYPAKPDTWRVRYTYDYDDIGKTSLNYKNRLFRVESNTDADSTAEVTKTSTYDALGRTLSDTVTATDFDNQPRTLSYSYTGFDEVSAINYPNNNKVVYNYDNLGRVQSIGTPSSETFYAAYTYFPDGTFDTATYNSLAPLARRHQFYIYGKLATISETIGGNPWFSEALKYDDALNILQSDGSDAIAAYQYDSLNRLTLAQTKPGLSAPWNTAQFSYDSNGNLGTFGEVTETLSGKTNQVETTTNSVSKYTYFQNGLLKQTPFSSGLTFSYDPGSGMTSSITAGDAGSKTLPASGTTLNSQQISAADITISGNTSLLANAVVMLDAGEYSIKSGFSVPAGAVAEFWTGPRPKTTNLFYQNETQRIIKSTSSEKTLYIHGESPYPLSEYVGQSVVRNYVYGPEGLVSMNDGINFFFSKDHLGSTRIVRDTDNRLVARFAYSPFGETLAYGDSARFRYRFAEQEYDPEVRLYNFRARFYDTRIGRFLAPDPDHQYPNPYEYVGNNPVNEIDPSGDVALARTVERLLKKNPAYKASKAVRGLKSEKLILEKMTPGVQFELVRRFNSGIKKIRNEMQGALAALKSGPHWQDVKNVFRPGGTHEMLAVSRVQKLHKLGVTVQDIQHWTIRTKDTFFQRRAGKNFAAKKFGHNTHKFESTAAHNEIFKIIDAATSKSQLYSRLKAWQEGAAGFSYRLAESTRGKLKKAYKK